MYNWCYVELLSINLLCVYDVSNVECVLMAHLLCSSRWDPCVCGWDECCVGLQWCGTMALWADWV